MCECVFFTKLLSTNKGRIVYIVGTGNLILILIGYLSCLGGGWGKSWPVFKSIKVLKSIFGVGRLLASPDA